MKTPLLYLTVIIAMLLTVLAAWQIQIVEIVLPRNGNQTFDMVRVNPKDIIKLRYRHSNELIQVEGRFSIDAHSRLHAIETRFESSGSGLPVEFPERTSKAGKWLIVDELNREIGTLRFYIVPINQSRLSVGKHNISIGKLKSGTLIEIKASRSSYINWLIRSIL